MNKLAAVSTCALACILLAGCHSKRYAVEPGYYQSGRYHAASEQGGYYDALGHYHPKHVKSGYYQSGRWHRAYISTVPDRRVPGGYVTGGIFGEVSPETLGRVASDGDLSGVAVGVNADGEAGAFDIR